jgi:ADP-ribose pyrophosphatase YjhB (NUDIX family)
MGAYFPDTSAIIKNYVAEAGHSWVVALCDPANSNQIYISQAALVEAVAAFCRMARARPRRFDVATRDRLIGEFRGDAATRFITIVVDNSTNARAADLCIAHPLRAYAAVQLACAITARDQRAGAGLPQPTFVCADVDLLAVAETEGLLSKSRTTIRDVQRASRENSEIEEDNDVSDERYVVNVEAAIYRGDRWLIVQRSAREAHAAGTLALVGGKVEHAGVADGILEQTLRREVREEVGVEIGAAMYFVRSSSFVADDGDPVVDIVFLCPHAYGEPRALDPAEVAAVTWMTLDQVLDHPGAPAWTKESLVLAEAARAELAR